MNECIKRLYYTKIFTYFLFYLKMDYTVGIILFIILLTVIIIIILFASDRLNPIKTYCQAWIQDKMAYDVENHNVGKKYIGDRSIKRRIGPIGHSVLAMSQFGYTYHHNTPSCSPLQTIVPNGFFGYPDVITDYGNAITQIDPFTYRANIKGIYLITVNEFFDNNFNHSSKNRVGIAVDGIITHISDVIGENTLRNGQPEESTMSNTLGNDQQITGSFLLSLPTNQNINVVNPYSTQITEVRSIIKSTSHLHVNKACDSNGILKINNQSLLTFILLAPL